MFAGLDASAPEEEVHDDDLTLEEPLTGKEEMEVDVGGETAWYAAELLKFQNMVCSCKCCGKSSSSEVDKHEATSYNKTTARKTAQPRARRERKTSVADG